VEKGLIVFFSAAICEQFFFCSPPSSLFVCLFVIASEGGEFA
jgi:hypothetical protein